MANGISQWNSVDVLGDDARLRYGHVVGVADVGLFIDFLCPNRRWELVPFDRVFLSDRSRCLDAHQLAAACRRFGTLPSVEILMRESAGEPWTWYPGEIFSLVRNLHYSWYSEVVVRWRHGAEHADVVPLTRIRWRLPVYWWKGPADEDEYGKLPERVRKGMFAARSIVLQTDHFPLVSAALKHRNTEATHSAAQAAGVRVTHDCVMYVQRRYAPVAQRREMTAVETEPLIIFHRQLMDYVSLMPEPAPPPTVDMYEGAVLPDELQIFSFLDTLTQTKLRAVCTAWNDVTESHFLAANLVLDTAAVRKTRPCKDFWLTYSLIAPLFKRLSLSTQRVLLTDRGRCLEGSHVIKVLDMIHFVAQRIPAIRLKTICLHRLDFSLMIATRYDTVTSDGEPSACVLHGPRDPSRNFSINLAGFISACSNLPCGSLQLTSCTITLEYMVSLIERQSELVLHVPTHVTQRVAGDGDVGCAVWSALEAGLTAPIWEQVHRLVECRTAMIAAVTAGEDCREFMAVVFKMLCAAQSADPRPSTHCRGKKFCLDGMERIRTKKLSVVALRFLRQLALCWVI